MGTSKDGYRIFIVEDNRWYGEMLEHHLSLNPDYVVRRFETGKGCLDNLHEKPDVITLDFSLPDGSGDQLFKRIKAINPRIPVIIISGQEDISTVVSLLKEGVYDYIVKDDDTTEKVWNTILKVRERHDLEEELETLREEVASKYDFNTSIKGNSPAIKKVFSLMEKASRLNITATIHGETGTGKELVAKAIHYNSAVAKKPFIAVNVAAIPKELIESELFGHEKGAFTGAMSRRIGMFEQANNGTIFLDEIGEMDINIQAKLLRVLQEREVTRVGGSQSIKVNSRVIVATHRDLAEEVKEGNFREDLYYRLLGLPIELPPLRERGNDILLLGKHFVDSFSKENGMGKKTLTKEARDKLMKYPWPGNVRELKAVMELAVALADEENIEAESITFRSNNSLTDFLLEETSLREYNQRIIKHFLSKYDNNVMTVSQKLSVGKSKIYQMLKEGEI